MTRKHYLRNADVVGRVLRYVAEYRGQWVALLVFSSPAWHIKARDQWLQWSPRQTLPSFRRHLDGGGIERPRAGSGTRSGR